MKNLILTLFITLLAFTSCTEDILTEIEYEINADSLAKVQAHRDSLLIASILNHKDSTIINVTVNVTVINKDSININIDSHDTTNITIVNPPTQPPTVYQPIAWTVTQPTCSVSTGSVTLFGLPDGVWTIMPFNITSVGNTKTFTGLEVGAYSIIVTNKDGYVSPAINFVILPQPIPTAPVIGDIKQPTKYVSTGSVELKELPSGIWIITRYPDKVAFVGTGKTTVVTGLKPKLDGAKCYSQDYTFTVTNDMGCTSPESDKVTINSYN